MNYLVIYYRAENGETKALLVTNEHEAPDVIPGKMVADGVIETENDVHAIISMEGTPPMVAESSGILMIGCGYDGQEQVEIADYE